MEVVQCSFSSSSAIFALVVNTLDALLAACLTGKFAVTLRNGSAGVQERSGTSRHTFRLTLLQDSHAVATLTGSASRAFLAIGIAYYFDCPREDEEED